MLYYDRIDVAERIGVNKTNASKSVLFVQMLSFNQMSAIDDMIY